MPVEGNALDIATRYEKILQRLRDLGERNERAKLKHWNSDAFRDLFRRLFPDDNVPKTMHPQTCSSWEHLCDFGKRAKNPSESTRASQFLPRNGHAPIHTLQSNHFECLQEALCALDVIRRSETNKYHLRAKENWWPFLDYVWTAITDEPPIWLNAHRAHYSDLIKRCNLNIPQTLGIKFRGRERFLIETFDTFDLSHSRTPATKIAIHGGGGFGKTRIAYEFVHRFFMNYKSIFFVSADLRENLEEQINKLATSLAPKRKGDSGLDALKAWFNNAENQRWLLVLDNVDTPEAAKAVETLCADLMGGHILVTTRLSRWPGFHLRPATTVSLAAAAEILTEDGENAGPLADAKALAKDLGCVASLLKLAAAYIAAEDVSFKAYRETWRTTRPAVLKWLKSPASKDYIADRDAKAAMTWHTSVNHLIGKPKELFEQIAWFAPAPIPVSLLGDGKAAIATVKVLERFSLVTPIKDENGDTTAIVVNEALQEFTRASLADRKSFAALDNATKLLKAAFKSDPRQSERTLLSHVLSILHFIRKTNVDQFNLYDAMSRLVVIAFKAASDEETPPEYLISILSNFYEVEPLSDLLNTLVEKESWTEWQIKLLKANNYVLRYAMAEAIAQSKSWPLERIQTGLKDCTDANTFEFFGYALGFRYAESPALLRDSTNRDYLRILSEYPAYSGRSILGDLFLNLAFSKEFGSISQLRTLVGDEFWDPIWDFIRLDIETIEAITRRKEKLTKDDPLYDHLAHLELVAERIVEIKKYPRLPESVRRLLEDYDKLGHNPNRISSARGALAKMDYTQLFPTIRILFSHPIWSVAEAAASVLSSIIEKHPERRADCFRIIDQLLKPTENWRVQFGACEAAFAVRHQDDRKLFYKSVRQHYKHENCKIRGLSAENLGAVILNSNTSTQHELLGKDLEKGFQKEIRAWVADGDCWVLEHVFRLFNTLGKDFAKFIPTETAPLLKKRPNCHRSRSRDEFLSYIEGEQRRIVEAQEKKPATKKRRATA